MEKEYGHVCFALTKNVWYDKAIAKIVGSIWSHTFLTVHPMLGREMVMEADSHDVSMTPFDKAYRSNPNENYEVYRFKITQEQKDNAILAAMDMLETPYGTLEFIYFACRAFLGLFGIDIKSHNNFIQQGTVCSGLVRIYITGAGYGNLFDGFGKDSANQQDVYNIVKAHPELFELIESKN